MTARTIQLAVAIVCMGALATMLSQSPQEKIPVGREKLCVTEGAITAQDSVQLGVDVPKMRAYVQGWMSQQAALRFTFVGPTADQVPLESGELRQQFGLKLLAQDACNLVYVMWLFQPESKIVVSLKTNPGQTTSSQCGNHGYVNIKPAHSSSVGPVAPGEAHELDADLEGTVLTVQLDGKEVWSGDVGQDAAQLTGPVGIRSDNARLTFALQVGPDNSPHSQFLRACDAGPDVSD